MPKTLEEAAREALKAIQDTLEDAYLRCFPECCGRPGNECCGNPLQAWSPDDQRIMNTLGPIERDLRAALASSETVRVPREPTDAMIDAPRQIILYAETQGRTLEGLRTHLEMSGVDYLSWAPVWATRECGHLTKGAIAILVYKAMIAAADNVK